MRHLRPCVYMMASKRNGVIYVGTTANLLKRAYEHRNGVVDGFSKKYGCILLVWYEWHHQMLSAIRKEKTIKKWRRTWKCNAIETINPEWNDLYDNLVEMW